jgi:hypothetical protein
MNITAIGLANDGQGLTASVTSAELRAVRERCVPPTFPGATGEVRPLAGARAMATMTVDFQDPARVRSWSPPV